MTDADGSGFSHPLLGLPPLLRAWRAEAGARLGLGRPLRRYEVAQRADVSERWYRKLESGEPVRPDRERIEKVATALGLDHPRKATLNLYASRQLPVISPDDGSAETIGTLTTLTSQLMPFPAWVSTATGDVVKSNAAANAWFPWMRRPGGNLSRWLLLNPEARDQVVDWPDQAAALLGLLRYAFALHSGVPRLQQLMTEVLADPECRRIWIDHPQVTASRNGARFAFTLPYHKGRRVDVIAYFLHPADDPTCRLAFLTPIGGPDGTPGSAYSRSHR